MGPVQRAKGATMSTGETTGGAGGEPGWHPDPWGQHSLRWWDGNQWTDQVHDDAGAGSGQDAVTSFIESDTGMAQASHLLAIVTGFLGPLIIWVTKGKEDPFVEQHAKEALNFQISMFIYLSVASLLILVLVGLVLVPILLILDIVFIVMETMKAGRKEASRYPMCIRLIS